MSVAGKFLMATISGSTFHLEFTTIPESVFNGIRIKILINIITAVMATTTCLGFNRPGIFHPTAFINVMN